MSQHRFHCPNNHNKTPLEGVASLHGDGTQTDTLVFYANRCRRCKQNSSCFRFPKKILFCWPNTTQSGWFYSKTVDPNRKRTPTSVDAQINSFQLRLNIRHRRGFRNEKSFYEKHLWVKSIYHFVGFYRFDRIVSWFYVKTSERDHVNGCFLVPPGFVIFFELISIVGDYERFTLPSFQIIFCFWKKSERSCSVG